MFDAISCHGYNACPIKKLCRIVLLMHFFDVLHAVYKNANKW